MDASSIDRAPSPAPGGLAGPAPQSAVPAVAPAASPAVVVAVPTYRRRAGLTRLLERLAGIRHPIAIIVADNDTREDGAADGLAVVAGLQRTGYPHPIEAIAVTERGIAQVRNALVARAIARPETRFIAMIDDDEWPEPNWIEALLAAQARCGAHVVGGPVRRAFEVPVADYLADANNYAPGTRRSGPTDLVDATSNVLLDADLFRGMAPPWFDPSFALTGGEDKDLMIGLKLDGKRFAWADEACVNEEMPASRCSQTWAIQRAFSTGNSDMLVNIKRRPPGFTVLRESVKIVGALAVALLNLALFWNQARLFEGQRLAARVGGKIAALLGHRHLEYKTTHGR